MCEPYNGWTNYPTWDVYLWLTNEPGCYNQARETAQAGADALHNWVEDELVDTLSTQVMVGTAGLSIDLLTWATSQVNWQEVVDALKEDGQ